jgi:hypothetical protein
MIDTSEFVATGVTFGGHPVLVLEESGVTFVSCKDVTGTLGQLEDWLHNHKTMYVTKWYFSYADKKSEIIVDGDKIKIACLEDNYKEFVPKLNKFINEFSRKRSV